MSDKQNIKQKVTPSSQEETLKLKEQAERLELQEKETELRKQQAIIERYETAMQVKTTFMNPDVWTQMRTMAKIFFDSHALPSCIKNEAQAIMVMQAGFESGMKPVESLQSLYIVNGAINIWGKATAKRLTEYGWRIQYINETTESCTAVVTKGELEYKDTFTYQMAVDSGYTKSRAGEFKVGWLPGANRKLKLRYNCLSMIIKSYALEVLGSAEDIVEVSEDFIPEKVALDTEKQQEIQREKPSVNLTTVSNLTERIVQSRQQRDKRVEEVKDNTGQNVQFDNIKPLDKQEVVEGVQIHS